MDNKINIALLKKYLSGGDLTREELLEVETALIGNEEVAMKIAEDLQEIPLSETLKKGIQKTGKQGLKKKIKEISNQLDTTGFFMDERSIQQYLKGTLEGQSLRIFENRLQSDKAFAERVEQEQKILKGVNQFGQKQLKDKLAKVQQGLEEKGFFEADASPTKKEAPEAKVVSFFNQRFLAVAASILLLVGFFFWNNQPTTFDIDQSFATHFPASDQISESIKDELSELGYTASEKENQERLLSAMAAYQRKDYEAAEMLFQEVLQVNPKQQFAQFYLGQSLLNQSKWALAIETLHPLGIASGFPLKADALWAEAYCELKQDNKMTAKSLLQQLTQFDNAFKNQATKVLKAL